LEGRKPYDKQITCCHSSGPRGMALAPQAAYFCQHDKDGDTVFINTLETSRATMKLGGKLVTVEQSSEFPRRGRSYIRLHVAGEAAFGVKIRRPERAVPTQIAIGEQGIKAGAPGLIFLPVRPRKDGDQIVIDYDLGARLIVGEHGNTGRAALGLGPFVMAFNQDDNPRLPVETLAWPKGQPRVLFPPETNHSDEFRLQAFVASSDGTLTLPVFVPFADAGARGGSYRVWLRDATATAAGTAGKKPIEKARAK
jgi:DUF1680 family protein